MYVALLEHLDEHPDDGRVLAAARLFTAGSASLPAADLRRFEAHTGHRVLERYGMTETLVTLSNPHDGERRPGSVGLALPGVASRVVDDDGTEVADGDPGELQVQTPGMMTGYRGRPADTAAAFDGPWFRTGDVVRRAPDGYFEIVGRRSVDIIKSGGFKIGAREIEDVLATHPAVAAVAVFGVPDRRWGERIAAAVVVRAPLPDPLAALQAHCADALADYKKPRQVLIVDALPRNAMGKVLKANLRDLARVDERSRLPTSG
jgi:acyl-CoA synthetase (AMP-forming)/AMP-acid ligase II